VCVCGGGERQRDRESARAYARARMCARSLALLGCTDDGSAWKGVFTHTQSLSMCV
jgi:hypothetical protein